MNIQEIVQILTDSGIEQNEANREVKMLIEHFCNYGTKDIIMGRPLDYEKLKLVKEKAIYRAKTKEPIQYIIGKAYFMGDFYKVNKNVLIPRDETEFVVRHALKIIDENKLKNVLEIGTGSGCIACSLAKYGKVNVTSVDISEWALNIAEFNANKLGVKINFKKSDIFSALDKNKDKFDLIISNPPYIPKGTKLQKEVEFEPSIALFTSEDTGTEFYQSIICDCKHYMNPKGYIVFELGINQSNLVKDFFTNNNFTNIVIQKDLADIDRIISAQKES